MHRHLIGILSLVFSSLLFAVPASAVTLPNCPTTTGTDFALVARDRLDFEGGNPIQTVINGNALVTTFRCEMRDRPPVFVRAAS